MQWLCMSAIRFTSHGCHRSVRAYRETPASCLPPDRAGTIFYRADFCQRSFLDLKRCFNVGFRRNDRRMSQSKYDDMCKNPQLGTTCDHIRKNNRRLPIANHVVDYRAPNTVFLRFGYFIKEDLQCDTLNEVNLMFKLQMPHRTITS